MFKTVWRLLLMFNGVSSDEDERRAAELRRRRDEELAQSEAEGDRAQGDDRETAAWRR